MRSYSVDVFDTIFDSQRVFRCLLKSVARPGKLFTLPPLVCDPIEAAARTLLDHEVTFCCLGEQADETAENLLRVTGARVSPVEEADFALISGNSAGATKKLNRGTLERPDRGATAIYAVEKLSDTGALFLELTGPGIPASRTLGVEGLAPEEAEVIRETRLDYPLGIDVYLIDHAGRVAGLPRSTRLKVGF